MAEHIQVTGFQWDDGNREKCQKHGIACQTLEDIFTRQLMVLPDHEHSSSEQRLKAIGKTRDNRYVFVVFTLRNFNNELLIRPISARYMHNREIIAYEKENPDIQNG
jgi:uncharacterized DUF497 family protein